MRGLALREIIPGIKRKVVFKELTGGIINGILVALVTALCVRLETVRRRLFDERLRPVAGNLPPDNYQHGRRRPLRGRHPAHVEIDGARPSSVRSNLSDHGRRYRQFRLVPWLRSNISADAEVMILSKQQ